jgi:hypothetical protein
MGPVHIVGIQIKDYGEQKCVLCYDICIWAEEERGDQVCEETKLIFRTL